MLKTIALTAALALSAVAGATAMPFAQDKTAAASDLVIQVREGCGPGMQWSERRKRCVRDSVRAKIRDAVQDSRCGRGRVWSDRRGRCVPR